MNLRQLTMIAVLACGFTSCSPQVGFPRLKGPPDLSTIPGLYILHPSSVARLKEKGYTNFSAKIAIDNDGTFEVASMPHCWMNMRTDVGYDSCSGTWRAEIPAGSSDYHLVLDASGFTPESAYQTLETNNIFRKNGLPPTLTLGIADRTSQRKEYALAVPLQNGDDNYLIFVKETGANPQGGAKGRQPVGSDTNRTSAAAASRRSP